MASSYCWRPGTTRRSPRSNRLWVADGIPVAQFAVDDVYAEVERLKGLGVQFTKDATDLGPVVTAVLEDSCGNLIQLVALK